jgi:transaldolase
MDISTGVHEDVKLIQTVRELALEGYKGPGAPKFASQEKYRWLRDLGSRLWLDTGDLAAATKVWSPELEALTTNNTLVYQVVSTGAMDGLIAYGSRAIRDAQPGISDQDLIMEIAFLVNARLALSLVEALGAHVSVELHPSIGFDVNRTIAYARRYYEINPDFFYVKIPLTPDGFISVRQLSSEGIPINYTLGFSARQNYLAARFSNPRFVNVFLGRLNAVVEENRLGKPENVGEKATLASNEAVKNLRKAGVATEQIAASIRNGQQVAALAGVDVFTIPPKAAGEYLALDITKEQVRHHNSHDLQVDLDKTRPAEAAEVRRFWEIDGEFVAFVEDTVEHADQMKAGKDLVEMSRKHGIKLFHDWSDEDRRNIQAKGKIPDVSHWPGVPLDDLMSMSALESFTKDQMELDQRIADLMCKA